MFSSKGVTNNVLLSTSLELLKECVVNALLDVDTRTSAANLTRVKVDTNVGKLNGLINVSIFKDNVGGVTTELKE